MSKYCLVASYYDMFEKNPSLKYKNEVVIDLPNIKLTTLQAIDKFTASHTRMEIFNILEKELGITGRNQLAVKFQMNKSSMPNYYKVIENNPEFVSCTEDNELKIYFDGTRALAVKESLFFLKEWRELLKVIEKRDLEAFRQMYPYEGRNLTYLVERFVNSSYDTGEEYMRELDIIKKELGKYKTFREWILAKDKNMTYKKSSVVKKTTTKQSIKFGLENIPKQTIQEIENDYEREFNNDEKNKDRGITYQSYQTYQYNVAYLDEDKEEFLEDEEIGFDDNVYYSKKR